LFAGFAIALFGTFASSNLCCQDKTSDPESYKLKIGGQFWYATPIATVAGSGTQVPISFDKALGFSTYSTFTSGLDWYFKRKHHLLFIRSPNQTVHTDVLNQTITFKNLTFQAGSSVAGTLRTYSYAQDLDMTLSTVLGGISASLPKLIFWISRRRQPA
jgi:hypothetical protein